MLNTLFDNDENILDSYLKFSPLTPKHALFSVIEKYHPTGLISIIYKEAFLLVRDTPVISKEQLDIRWDSMQTYLTSLPIEASCKISQIFFDKSKIAPSEPSFRLFMIHPDIFFNAIFCFINIQTLKSVQEWLFTFSSDTKDPYLLSLKKWRKR